MQRPMHMWSPFFTRKNKIEERVNEIQWELSRYWCKEPGQRFPGPAAKPSRKPSKAGTAEKCPDPNRALFDEAFPEWREEILLLTREWKALVEEYQKL